jgi:hypothetical protein
MAQAIIEDNRQFCLKFVASNEASGSIKCGEFVG